MFFWRDDPKIVSSEFILVYPAKLIFGSLRDIQDTQIGKHMYIWNDSLKDALHFGLLLFQIGCNLVKVQLILFIRNNTSFHSSSFITNNVASWYKFILWRLLYILVFYIFKIDAICLRYSHFPFNMALMPAISHFSLVHYAVTWYMLYIFDHLHLCLPWSDRYHGVSEWWEW